MTYTSITSTRFPNDEVRSSGKSLEPGARSYRKRYYFVRSPPGVIGRLKAAAIEFAQIATLIAGCMVSALCALDLLDMLRW